LIPDQECCSREKVYHDHQTFWDLA
jgi:hypothetical protein